MSYEVRGFAERILADWWNNKSKIQQKNYLDKHPNSKYAGRTGGKDSDIPSKKSKESGEPSVEDLKKQWTDTVNAPFTLENQKRADDLMDQIRKHMSTQQKAPSQEKPIQERPRVAPTRDSPPPKKTAPSPAPAKPKKGKISRVSKSAEAHKAAEVHVSDAERQALNEYTGSLYLGVNKALRTGSSMSKEDRKAVKLMDDAFSRASTTQDIQVFRGVGPTDMDRFANLKPGDSYKDDAFLSTSTDEDTADNFVRGDSPTMLNIKVPKGSKAISVDSLSQFKKGGHAVRSEEEILLNRGGSYRVVSITPARRGKPRIVNVEYQG
jgi:hypothetical protein